MAQNPKVFISYSWDSEAHKSWVASLAGRLRNDGVEVRLDQWHTVPGDQLPSFMEREIRENEFVLIICTPNYKAKSDMRLGGVGYEGDIMTAEVFSSKNDRKFIPILKEGIWAASAPSCLSGKYYVDLSREEGCEDQYYDLLTTLHGKRESPPPLGPVPDFGKKQKPTQQSRTSAADIIEPIRIEGMIIDGITEPKLDGTPRSALYSIPFRLNRKPSHIWEQIFLNEWEMPPHYTSMHRPGIASVVGDRIILDGTTINEVKKYHRDTLVLCVEEANKKEAEYINKMEAEEERRRQQSEQHKKHISEIADDIEF